MEINKKGYFFSVDAFIGLLLILAIVILIKPQASYLSYETRVHDNFLKTMSDITVGELNDSYVQLLIANGTITNTNNTILDQIGEFYALNDPTANYIAQNIIDRLDLNEGLSLYYDDVLIANNSPVNFSNNDNVRSSRFLITGIMGGVNASSGFSSRAFLFSENKIKYFYFGGYVGDGNVTVYLGENVESAIVEGDFYENFTLYINDIFVDTYNVTPGIPQTIDLSLHSSKFASGENNMSFKSNSRFAVAGGFIRVVYNDSNFDDNVKYLPGIEGFINLFDGFIVPGNLTGLDIFLHYNSTFEIFLSIGDVEVYRGNSSGGELNVTLSNSTLFGLLNYSLFSDNTVPLRVGILNVTDIEGTNRDSDVYSVTDISGSMAPSCSSISPFWCCWTNDCSVQSTCEGTCSGTYENKIQAAKDANKEFVGIVLNYTGNQVGLVAYENDVSAGDTHSLSNNTASLNSTIDSWSEGGGTCICCGINEAKTRIVSETNGTSLLSMVVMSDGDANVQCSEQGTGDAKNDAIQAACDAYNDEGIIVYAIGFGSGADETTLQDIASCGQGDYYYGDVDDLTDIYRQIADDILNAAYEEQRIIGNGSVMTLYPDSKITLEYDTPETPYGLEITSESNLFGNIISDGYFNLPNDSTAFKVGVVSYSGSKWTELVHVYNNTSASWTNVFNLTEYGTTYTDLGDPYIINIPVSQISAGRNDIRVTTAVDPTNSSSSSSSIYNKIIYTIVKDIAAYSPVLPSANGCIWHVEFEDSTNETRYFPSDYNGSDHCYFASDDYFFPGNNVLLANSQDAISVAILNLFEILDLNNNNRLETKFTDSDLDLSSVEIEGLPFTVSTEVQARTWR
jgi:hypothetical protein